MLLVAGVARLQVVAPWFPEFWRIRLRQNPLRRCLLALLMVLFFHTNQMHAAPNDSSDSLKLWYNQPADQWSEAMPIGNGRLGAMVYGGIEQEHLQLNEDTLWSGGPSCYDNPGAFGHLANVRTLLKKGEYAEAEATAQKMMGKPIYQAAYQPLGDLYLRFPSHQNAINYRRELDLRNAVSSASYRVGDARFTRKIFASHPDQSIVVRLECDKPGRLTFDLQMTSPHPFQTQSVSPNTLLMTGQLAPRRTDPRASGSRALIAPWEGEGMKFAAQVNFVADGGTAIAQDDKLSVQNADTVTIYYSAATNFVNRQDVSGNPLESAAKYLADLQGKSFDQILQRHVADYSALFDRVTFDLNGA